MRDDIAICCAGVSKTYRLYQSAIDMAMDRFGLGAFMRWKRGVAPVEFTALRDVDLEIAKGERVGIVGRNGAGKTTLLRMISGASTNSIVPTRGTISVHGMLHALMGLESSNPDLTGRENARSALVYNGLTGRELDAALDDIVDFVELGDFIDRPVQNYSLGMGMRLNFAVATALSPDIVLIDEVLGAGDARFAKKASERMRRLIHSGCTSVLVSHSTELIEQFCDRVVWLNDGRVALDGPAAEVLAAYGNFSVSHAAPGPLAWRPVTAKAPSHARKEFIRSAVAEAEGFGGQSGTLVTLPSGIEGYRRNPPQRARISDVRLYVKTDESLSLNVGGALRLEIDIEPILLNSEILCVVEIYALDGKRVARLIDQKPQIIDRLVTVTVAVDQTLLGAREYVGTVALLDPENPYSPEGAYDTVSQALFIQIANVNDTDPPFVHLEANWLGGTARLDGRISAVL